MGLHPPPPLTDLGATPTAGAASASDDAEPGEGGLVAALRRGDERVFSALVDRHHASMIRVARMYVSSAAAAEEVAQEAWLGVIQGLAAFQGRCTLKAWIFAIVVNCARNRGARDQRTVPFSALGEDEGGPSVDPDRFNPDDHPRWPGHWSQPPRPWTDDQLASRQTLRAITAAVEKLPAAQRAVMTMRDVEGLESEEVCQALGISEGNQRVLLHRARSRVRAVLEATLTGDEALH